MIILWDMDMCLKQTLLPEWKNWAGTCLPWSDGLMPSCHLLDATCLVLQVLEANSGEAPKTPLAPPIFNF